MTLFFLYHGLIHCAVVAPTSQFLDRGEETTKSNPPPKQPHGFYVAFRCRKPEPSGRSAKIPTTTLEQSGEREP